MFSGHAGRGSFFFSNCSSLLDVFITGCCQAFSWYKNTLRLQTKDGRFIFSKCWLEWLDYWLNPSFAFVITVRNYLFADSCTLVAHSLEDMHWILSNISCSSKDFYLTIRIKKTELVHQCNREHLRAAFSVVYVDRNALKMVSSFTYLSSICPTMQAWIKKLSPVQGVRFGRPYHRQWNRYEVSLELWQHCFILLNLGVYTENISRSLMFFICGACIHSPT